MKFFIVLVFSAIILFSSVDINTAGIDELRTLKGIGPSKAQAIVTFRKGHCFKTVDELSMVKGVGPKTLEKNRADLSVSKCSK